MVYDVDRLDTVYESESPDFKLQHRDQSERFGVEITEFYPTGSDARLRNMRGYLPSLFAGGQALHREDVDALKVQEAVLIRADRSGEEVIDVIKRELPEVSTYVRAVAAAIERKDQKVARYERGLSHVNLIVLDHGNRLITEPPEQFYPLFYTRDLRNVLIRTRFREVFFATILGKTSRVFVPLKALLLLSEFYMFYWGHGEYHGDKEYDSIRTELELFVEYMLQQGASLAIMESAEEEIQLVWGNYGIVVSNSGIAVRDYADHAVPRGIDPTDEDFRGSLLDPSFLSFLEDFRRQNTFITDMSNDVLEDFRT